MLLQHSSLNEDSPFYWEGPDGRRVMAWFARAYQQLKPHCRPVNPLASCAARFLCSWPAIAVTSTPWMPSMCTGLHGQLRYSRPGARKQSAIGTSRSSIPKIIPATDADYYSYLSRSSPSNCLSFAATAVPTGRTPPARPRRNHHEPRHTAHAAAGRNASPPGRPSSNPGCLPAAELHDAWKQLLFYDEHTWGAHNSIAQPDRRFVTDAVGFQTVATPCARTGPQATLLTRAMSRLMQNIHVAGPTMFVFNPDFWPRTGEVRDRIRARTASWWIWPPASLFPWTWSWRVTAGGACASCCP